MVHLFLAAHAHLYRRRGNAVRAGINVKIQQLVPIGLARNPENLFPDDRLDVLVINVLLLIRQLFEAHEGAVHVFLAQIEAQVLQPLIESMAPRVFAHDQPVPGNAYRFRRHDLIGLLMFEHAVLMNPGFMGEGVVADDRLVDRESECR